MTNCWDVDYYFITEEVNVCGISHVSVVCIYNLQWCNIVYTLIICHLFAKVQFFPILSYLETMAIIFKTSRSLGCINVDYGMLYTVTNHRVSGKNSLMVGYQIVSMYGFFRAMQNASHMYSPCGI